MFGGQRLGLIHLFDDERGDQVSVVWEIAVERGLSHPGVPRDLAHGNVRALGIQFAGGGQDRLTIALGVFAEWGLAGGGHGSGLRGNSVVLDVKLDSILHLLYN
jgi:hypothetical protein